MINRKTLTEITALMKQFPAVTILGARQIGKTTIAKQVAKKLKAKAIYFDLEKASDRRKLNDIETMLSQNINKCVIVDEAQAMPELFTALRPSIDEKRKPGRFLLLGSVSPTLAKGVSETLAGRVANIELPPVNVLEALKAKISLNHLWFRGGYPEALTLKTNTYWYNWVENYYRNFIERDVNFLTNESLSPSTVSKLWAMLTSINGNILNYESISRSLGVSRPTVVKYLDFLESAFLITRLQPWFINISKRIVKAPKVYFRDSGILHYLNGIRTFDDLQTHIAVGASWEGFVIEQIKQLRPKGTQVYFYRTHHGAEADLVIVRGSRPVACVEIKLSNTPQLTKGWYEVTNDLKTKTNFVVTPASDDYLHNKITRVCSLHIFLTKYLSNI